MFRLLTGIVVFSMIAITFMPRVARSQTGDFNADGLYDCSDLDLLQANVRDGSTDEMFDLNGSGGPIDLDDVDAWFEERTVVSGYHTMGDFNVDDAVDERDGNIMGINWQQQGRNYCQGDANLDGVVNSADKGVMDVNFLTGTAWPNPRPHSEVTLSPISDSLTVWTSGQPAVIAETDQFQLTARPVLSPDGLLVTVVGLRTRDPGDRVVSITDVAFGGDVHQVGFPTHNPGFIFPTTTVQSFLPERDGDLARADSHMLVWMDDQAMPIIFGLRGMMEENDSSNPNALDADMLGGTFAVFGIGPLQMPADYGGFVLRREKQSQYVELVQVTTPARMPGTDSPGQVSMSIGVLGADAAGMPMDEWARIGIEMQITVPFLFPPCDFDHDGLCSVEDVNRLVDAIGTEDQQIDLAPPIDVIDTHDIDAWLSWASDLSLDRTFRRGDVNLDGSVDSNDLNVLGLHWQQRLDRAAWDKGDFNGDRIVNAHDLNVLGVHWRFGSQVGFASVPEPTMSLSLAAIVMIWLCLVKQRSHPR